MLLLTRIARTIVATALVAAAMPGLADAQLTKAGVVTTLQGTATVARASAPQPMPLRFKDEVFVQDRITTGNDSVARILLGGKAIVTVRERSVLTITEVPGTSTIDLGIGKIALAVVKERMKSGETIEIRTPNAVAGIRGTVVITEVDQTTAQLTPSGGAFTSRFTVLQGVVAVSQYNPVTRQLGPSVNLGALQTTGITGSAAPRPPVTLTPEAAKELASEYKTTIKEAPPAANASLTNSQVQQAVSHVGSVLGPRQEPPRGDGASAKSDGDAKSGGPEPSTGGALSSTSTGSSGTGGGLSLGNSGAPSGERSGAVGSDKGLAVSGSSTGGGGQTLGGGGSSGGAASGGGASSGGGPKLGGGGSSGGGPVLSGGGSSGGGGPKLGGSGSSAGGGGLKIGGGGTSGGGGGLKLGGSPTLGGGSSGGGGGLKLGGSPTLGGGSSGAGGLAGVTGPVSGAGAAHQAPKLSGDDLKKHSESKGNNRKNKK